MNGSVSNSTILNPNNYYVLKRNNLDYLIYVTELFDSSFDCYSFEQNINLIIGNDPTCNINFLCPYIQGICLTIKITDSILILEHQNNCNIYINSVAITSEKYFLKSGDQLNIYGLKIMFLNGIILINNPQGNVQVNLASTNLSPQKIKNDMIPQDIEVKDIDLYQREDYFSKSPRIRRIIQTKEIDLSPPPKIESESEMPLILTIGPMMTMGVTSLVILINTISKITLVQRPYNNLGLN